MIHIDFADGSSAWLTDEQLKDKYPELHASLNKPAPYKEDGLKLRKIRQEMGYCTRELAKMLNMKASEISSIEQGRILPSQEIVDYYGNLKNILVI